MVLSDEKLPKVSPDIQTMTKLLEDRDKQILHLTKQLQSESKQNFELDSKLRELCKEYDALKNSSEFAGIEKFACRLAHDLRNPLSTIKNIVELLETRPQVSIENKLIQYRRLDQAVNRIIHGIEDVLEYAVVPELNCKPYKVADLISLAMINMTIPDTVRVRVRKNDSVIHCDQKMMISAFSNLILNAVQAAQPEGIVDVKIDETNESVSVSIEDSGPGIDDGLLEKVFEPLYTTKQVGIGLGLSICKNIIHRHNGTIFIKNAPTTAHVVLPRTNNTD